MDCFANRPGVSRARPVVRGGAERDAHRIERTVRLVAGIDVRCSRRRRARAIDLGHRAHVAGVRDAVVHGGIDLAGQPARNVVGTDKEGAGHRLRSRRVRRGALAAADRNRRGAGNADATVVGVSREVDRSIRKRGRAGQQIGHAQVLPDQEGFIGRGRGIPGATDAPVAARFGGGRAGVGTAHVLIRGRVVARHEAEAVLICVDRGRHGAEVIHQAFRLGAVDQFLTLQHAAEQQTDNDQYDGDFDQGETLLRGFHEQPPFRVFCMFRACFGRISPALCRVLNPQRFFAMSAALRPFALPWLPVFLSEPFTGADRFSTDSSRSGHRHGGSRRVEAGA